MAINYIPFIETFSDLFVAIFPALLPFILVIIILDILRYLWKKLTLRRPIKLPKPLTVKVGSLTASSDYSLSKPEILGLNYELIATNYCPSCEAKLSDSNAFFCVLCGYQVIKPKVEWID